MWDLPLYTIIFIVSLVALIKAADYFTDSAEKIGLFLGLSPFIIGVTIVSIGTSLPELMSSLLGVFKGSSEIVLGNLVGSNIANIFLIIGIAAVISSRVVKLDYDLVSVDLPLFVGSAFLLTLMVWDENFTRGEAVFLILGFVVYVLYAINSRTDGDDGEGGNAGLNKVDRGRKFLIKQFSILALSTVFIFLGANFTIDSISRIAEILNIGKEIIAVSALALGTSLPELAVTISASRQGKPEIAIGNVLGSNIFNSFMIMGIPGLIKNLEIPKSVLTDGIPVMLIGTILVFFTIQDKKVTRWEGWLFLLFYGWFIGKTFNLI